jgi:hypothetical protein
VITSWLGLLLFVGWCYRYAARPEEAVTSPHREPVSV